MQVSRGGCEKVEGNAGREYRGMRRSKKVCWGVEGSVRE